MKEFKGTKGNWYIERTSSEEGDFQCRILSNVGKVWHAGGEKDQIMIIVGEPTKKKGQANIHFEPNAKLIANAPKMLHMLQTIQEVLDAVAYPSEREIIDISESIEKLLNEILN